MRFQRIDPLEQAETAVNRVEHQAATENLKAIIDSVWHDIAVLHGNGALDTHDFRVLQHRLWVKREEVCDILLAPTKKAS